MKLKLITIENFRGILKLTNLQISDLNSFVGKNDTGKSAILKALHCFFYESKFDPKDFFKGMNDEEKTIIQLSFTANLVIDDLALDAQGMLTIRKEFYLEKNKVKNDSFYICNDFDDEGTNDLWNKKESDLNDIIGSLGEEVVKSGRGNKNLFRIEQIKKIKEKDNRKEKIHPLGDLLKNLQKAYNVILPEYSIFEADSNLDVSATNFQSQFKSIILNYFDTIKDQTDEIELGLEKDLAQEFEEIRRFMAKNAPALKKITPSSDFNWSKSLSKFDVNMNFDGENFDIPLSHKGTGFRRLLMVAYFEYLAHKKAVNNQIFAIEEPEAYLHPSAQEDLLNSIISISKKSQFFLTTHSPIFAGATSGDNSILVTKTDEGFSEYYRGEDIIPRIITELGIKADYNLLRNAKHVIFVEGRDDVLFMKIVTQTLYGKDLDAENILCIPGGGSALRNYAELDLFKEISRSCNYSVFVDGDNGDSSKQVEKDRIKEHCEKDGATFKQLLKREIENYACPECIKQCYKDEIICKEGENSKNPRLAEIDGMEIEIDSTTDVEEYLQENGFQKFKSGRNIKVFEMMSKKSWEKTDSANEIKDFLKVVFDKTTG